MRIRPPFPAVVVFLALLGPHAAARAADDGGSLYGVNEKIHGKTYAEWTVAWFQWALGTRADRNPALDKTGAFAGEGQRGPVWFLGGNFGGATTRTFVLPAGKAIFSPVLYKLSTTSLTEQAKRDLDTARDMEVTLDGKSVGDRKSVV